MKRAGAETVEEADLRVAPSGDPVPGLVLIHTGAGPALFGIAVGAGIELGRGPLGGLVLDDDRMSRQHAKVTVSDGRWTVHDLHSRNGTFVDGERVAGKVSGEMPKTLRVGRSLFLPVADVRPFEGGTVERRLGAVIGPMLRLSWMKIERAAKAGDALLLTGESGVGKEVAACAFHALGPRAQGPFIAVNCAAIPEGLAERLLFGTKKGAYSGAAADADGYVQAADKGTLFLDEVAELDPAVQAKLLRVLEAKEVLALGASRPRTVDVQVCSATRDLRHEVETGRFREDLYFRIGRPEVSLPPLRARREELPWLIAQELGRVAGELSAHVSLVEACALRPWPGNIRELLGEVRRAGHDVVADGRSSVEARDLGEGAGMGLTRSQAAEKPRGELEKDAVLEALRANGGNVTKVARELGVHRTQLRRFLAKHGLDAKDLGPTAEGSDD